MVQLLGKMLLNDTKKSNHDFLCEVLKSRPTKKLGVSAFYQLLSDFENLPGDPEIVLVKAIYTPKLFWLLEGEKSAASSG